MGLNGKFFLVLCALAVMLTAGDFAYAFEIKKRGEQRPGPVGMRSHQVFPADSESRRALSPFMGHDRARSAVRQGEIMPLSDIRQRVREQFQGRIVGIDLQEGSAAGPQPWVYDLRVLTPEGHVLSVQMDAQDGEVIGVRGRQ